MRVTFPALINFTNLFRCLLRLLWRDSHRLLFFGTWKLKAIFSNPPFYFIHGFDMLPGSYD